MEKAARFGLAEREVEKARLFWHRGDSKHAQTCLGRVMNSHYGKLSVADVQNKSRSDQLAHAEVSVISQHRIADVLLHRTLFTR